MKNNINIKFITMRKIQHLLSLLAAGMLSFGGLCVAMQTVSLLGNLPSKSFLLGKLLQTGFALGLALAYLQGKLWYWIFPVVLAFIVLFRKKAVAFSKKPLYNG